MMMTVVLLSITRTATPSPAPNGPSGAADVALSGYYFGILLLTAALAVIVIALVFAFRYHARLLDVIERATVKTGQPLAAKSKNALATARYGQGPEPTIVGPHAASPATQLVFEIQGLPDDATITWAAEGGTPASGDGTVVVTKFKRPGEYEVTADYSLASGDSGEVSPKKVTIGAPGSSAITLPFVIQNWGRLVVVIFGIGVVAALMSIGVLDAAGGIGLLGVLLGVGAVTASGGGSAEKEKPAEDE